MAHGCVSVWRRNELLLAEVKNRLFELFKEAVFLYSELINQTSLLLG